MLSPHVQAQSCCRAHPAAAIQLATCNSSACPNPRKMSGSEIVTAVQQKTGFRERAQILVDVFTTRRLEPCSNSAKRDEMCPCNEDEMCAYLGSLNFGTELSIAETAAVKRIKFESLTIVLANLKSKATTDFMWPAQKIPNAEKQARLISQPEAVRN